MHRLVRTRGLLRRIQQRSTKTTFAVQALGRGADVVRRLGAKYQAVYVAASSVWPEPARSTTVFGERSVS